MTDDAESGFDLGLLSETLADAEASGQEDAAASERELRLRAVAAGRLSGLRIVLQGLNDHGNRAAILRTAEAFGLLNVHELAGPEGRAGATCSGAASRVSRGRHIVNGAEKWLRLHRHASAAECVDALHAEGCQAVAAMPPEARLTGCSPATAANVGLSPVALEELDFARPLALVFGSEGYGVSAELLALCDGAFTIPLVGLTESLNVSVAAALCCHYGRLRRCAALGLASGRGDLSPEEAEALVQEYERRGRDRNFAAGLRAQRAKDAPPAEKPWRKDS